MDAFGVLTGIPDHLHMEVTWRNLDNAMLFGGRRFTTDVERVLFALVANCCVDPRSKLSAAEWATFDATIPGWTAWVRTRRIGRWTC